LQTRGGHIGSIHAFGYIKAEHDIQTAGRKAAFLIIPLGTDHCQDEKYKGKQPEDNFQGKIKRRIKPEILLLELGISKAVESAGDTFSIQYQEENKGNKRKQKQEVPRIIDIHASTPERRETKIALVTFLPAKADIRAITGA
jgi:hypothetical protein